MKKKNVWELQDFNDKKLRNTLHLYNKKLNLSITIFFDEIKESTGDVDSYLIFNNGKITAFIDKSGSTIISFDDGRELSFPKDEEKC